MADQTITINSYDDPYFGFENGGWRTSYEVNLRITDAQGYSEKSLNVCEITYEPSLKGRKTTYKITLCHGKDPEWRY